MKKNGMQSKVEELVRLAARGVERGWRESDVERVERLVEELGGRPEPSLSEAGAWLTRMERLPEEPGAPKVQRSLNKEGGVPSFRLSLASSMVQIMEVMSRRSTCPDGRRHAALLVKGGRILATGYNGPPRGWAPPKVCALKSDELGKDFRCCPCVHAEVNAVVNAARAGVCIEGAELYCTKRPCTACGLMLENCGLSRIHFLED